MEDSVNDSVTDTVQDSVEDTVEEVKDGVKQGAKKLTDSDTYLGSDENKQIQIVKMEERIQ